MLNEDQSGIATVAVVIAVVAVASGTIGTSVVVDEIDVQPDSAFYVWERTGEKIKGATFAGGQGWEVARGEERTFEFTYMADRGKAGDYTGLLDDAGDHFNKAIESASNVNGLQVAQEAINKHIGVLENVRENIPDVAKPAISLAISIGAKGKAVVAGVAAGRSPGRLTRAERNEIRDQLRNIRGEAKALRSEIREKRGRGVSASEIVQSIELRTARSLSERARELAGKAKEQAVIVVAEEAQNRLDAGVMAAVDNVGLQRALKAVSKHVRVLENVIENVPDEAKSAIENALVYSLWQERVLENVKEKLKEGQIPPGLLKEELENKAVALENLMKTLENKWLPPGVLKEILENRDIPFENLKELIENRCLSPGILKEIIENREISYESLENFLQERTLPPGILKEILEKKGISPENLAGILENDWQRFVHERGRLPDWVSGPPSWAGPKEQPGGKPEGTEEKGEEPEGPGYNLLDGVRIQSPPAAYLVNPRNDQGLDNDNVIREIREAFETWDNETSVEIFIDEVSTTYKSGFYEDNENVISFAQLEDNEVAAETRIWYDEGTKNVLEFDIVLNSEVEWGIDPDGEGPETIEAYDLQNIATHEAGHTLVLLDITDDDYAHLTMYYQSEPESTVKISLENEDIAGLHELYGE